MYILTPPEVILAQLWEFGIPCHRFRRDETRLSSIHKRLIKWHLCLTRRTNLYFMYSCRVICDIPCREDQRGKIRMKSSLSESPRVRTWNTGNRGLSRGRRYDILFGRLSESRGRANLYWIWYVLARSNLIINVRSTWSSLARCYYSRHFAATIYHTPPALSRPNNTPLLRYRTMPATKDIDTLISHRRLIVAWIHRCVHTRSIVN